MGEGLRRAVAAAKATRKQPPKHKTLEMQNMPAEEKCPHCEALSHECILCALDREAEEAQQKAEEDARELGGL